MNRTKLEKKPNILLVEDELESQKYFELVLKKKFEVDFCDSKKSMYTLLGKKIMKLCYGYFFKRRSNGVDLIES